MDLNHMLAYIRSPTGKRHIRWALLGGGGLFALTQLLKTRNPAKRQLQQNRSRKARKLNQKFVNELKWLIKVMVPRVWCRESGVLVLHSATLICRTFLSIYVAYLEVSLFYFIFFSFHNCGSLI